MIVDGARRIGDELLVDAQRIDQCTLIGRERFASLADAGLFGIAGPHDAGGADLDPVTSRRVIAAISGGCGATFFSWVQHHGVVRTIRSSADKALRDEFLAPMCRGEVMAGVAFAHLRRTGRRAVTATRVEHGWRFDGFAPWATSWGIADLFAVAAESDDGQVVWGLVPGVGGAGVTAEPLGLPVFASTGTVALRFDGCTIPADRIAAVQPVDAWRLADRHLAALGQPAVLGVAARAIGLLGAAARHADDPAADAAVSLRTLLDARWADDTRLLGDLAGGQPSDALVAEAGDHRAACLDLGAQATRALLAAVGGGGMDLDHPAQRLAREASFYVIQAQTGDGRSATLRSAAGR